jgi:hypothetical protein
MVILNVSFSSNARHFNYKMVSGRRWRASSPVKFAPLDFCEIFNWVNIADRS